MRHNLVGALVSGRFQDGQRLALVTNVVFPRRGLPYATGRIHGGPDTLVPPDSWNAIVGRYKGPSCRFLLTSMVQVLPGVGEGWVAANEYMEWSEA